MNLFVIILTVGIFCNQPCQAQAGLSRGLIGTEPRDGIPPKEKMTESDQETKAVPVAVRGTLICEPRRYNPKEFVDIDLIESSGGNKVHIASHSQELKALCVSDKKNAPILEVEGVHISNSFLFWGGGFEISRIKSVEPVAQK